MGSGRARSRAHQPLFCASNCTISLVSTRSIESPQNSKTPQELQGFQATGRGRIRTCEGVSHQIYSLTRLSTSVHARVFSLADCESGKNSAPGGKFKLS